MEDDYVIEEEVVVEVVEDDEEEIIEEIIIEEEESIEEEYYSEEEIIEEEVVEVEEDETETTAEVVIVKAAATEQQQQDISIPQVDWHALVLTNAGLRVTKANNNRVLGRIVVATRAFGLEHVYQPILRERPALVCHQEDYIDFMEKVLQAPVLYQIGILDMCHQPLDSPRGKELGDQARILWLLGIMDDADDVLKTIHQLLSIRETNGLQYNKEGTPYTALALFGSKFAHSCAPNLGYSPEAAAEHQHALEFKLLKPVQEGEMLAFSYLTDLLETPTNERRHLLMDTKSFWCQCSRCQGPDYCRCLCCPTCAELVPCQYNMSNSTTLHDNNNEAYWDCPNCGLLEADSLASVERQFAKMLEMIRRTVEGTRAFDANMNSDYNSPTTLKELVHECETELSPTHHLTIKALRLLFSTATKHAYVQIKKMILRGPMVPNNALINTFLRTSIDAGYKLVLAGECVASNCSGCHNNNNKDDAVPQHDPNYDRALPMSHVSDNLIRLPIFWWPSMALTMTLRYMPILRARFGRMANHIQERIVDKWQDKLICRECGTYWNAFKGSTTPNEAAELEGDVLGAAS